jgi:hypothetical protein
MASQPTQPQTIGGVLDTTFQLYKASLVPSIPLCLLLVAASLAPSIYVFVQGGGSADPFAMGVGALSAFSSPTYWVIYIASIIGSLWALGALYLKIAAVGSDSDMAVGVALGNSIGRVPSLLLTTILFAIAFVIGCILLIIPGLILLISLMPAFNLVLFEGKGPVTALIDSHKLVWGNWWRTFAILTVGFIIVIVIYVLAGFLVGVTLPFASGDGLMFGLLSGVAIGLLMNVLVTPFYVALVIAIYWDLKLRKEGGDLAARVGALNPA